MPGFPSKEWFSSKFLQPNGSRLRRLGSAQSMNVSSNTLVAGAKAMVGYQVLPDRSGINDHGLDPDGWLLEKAHRRSARMTVLRLPGSTLIVPARCGVSYNPRILNQEDDPNATRDLSDQGDSA